MLETDSFTCHSTAISRKMAATFGLKHLPFVAQSSGKTVSQLHHKNVCCCIKAIE